MVGGVRVGQNYHSGRAGACLLAGAHFVLCHRGVLSPPSQSPACCSPPLLLPWAPRYALSLAPPPDRHHPLARCRPTQRRTGTGGTWRSGCGSRRRSWTPRPPASSSSRRGCCAWRSSSPPLRPASRRVCSLRSASPQREGRRNPSVRPCLPPCLPPVPRLVSELTWAGFLSGLLRAGCNACSLDELAWKEPTRLH